jgi:photosystem II stability/assembly factor-like uncharacterized protein
MHRADFVTGVRHLLQFVLTRLLLIGSLLLGGQEAFCASERAPSPWLEDAALYDLACPDSQYAWAVGDRGAIWHTEDGGVHWQIQASGVRCALRGVCFVNRQIGWTVGGQRQPYSDVTRAVLLRTDNGGNSWHPMSTRLPALRQIQFFDPQHGMAWGHGSGSDPAGLFTTDDGGRSWRSLGGGSRQLWLGGHFVNGSGLGKGWQRSQKVRSQGRGERHGIVVGRSGRAAQWDAGKLSPIDSNLFGGRPLRDVALLSPVQGWLVGDGGLVLRTDDLGHGWQTVPSLSTNRLGRRDIHTVAVRDQHIWLAGSPGTHILHSSDAGQSWQQQVTGCQMPLHRVRFATAQHGWAVGSQGTILATDNGGQSWQIQHQGSPRVALLGLFSTVDNLPLLALAKLSREEAYRVAVRVLFEPQADPGQPDLGLETRLSAGLGQLHVNSATSAWQFTLPSDRLQLTPVEMADELNRRHDHRAAERLIADLVRQIRLWRPEAVLVSCNGPEQEKLQPLDKILKQAVLAAVDQAADPTQQIDQITQLGLAPWHVRRVLGWISAATQNPSLSLAGSNNLRITTHEIAFRNGQTLGDLARGAQRLLGSADAAWKPQAVPPEQRQKTEETFVLLANHPGEAVAGNDRTGHQLKGHLLAGLNLRPGSVTRRPPTALTKAMLAHGGVRALRKRAERQRNLRKLLRTTTGSLSQEALLTEVAKQAGNLERMAGAELLLELAQLHRTAGQLDRAAETLQLLVDRDPQNPLVESALQWLVTYYVSGEVAHLYRHTHSRSVQQATAIEDFASTAAVPTSRSKVITGNYTGSLSPNDRLALAIQLTKKVTAPTLTADPTIRWPAAVAQRKQGFPSHSKRYLHTLSQRSPDNPWQACAQAEMWLARPQLEPLHKPMAHCFKTAEKPLLDGNLDEALWATAKPMKLLREGGAESGKRKAESGEWEAESGEGEEQITSVWLARDEENLYLAIRCPKVNGIDYPKEELPHATDGDLSAYDRVRLLLDIDRDYRSYYELTIDSRGGCAESCYGNTHWNPQWVVAVTSDQHRWTAEAAIPMHELVGEPIHARHVWAIGIDRVAPGVGLQSWTGPTFDQPGPENFGLLIFD